MKIVQFEQPGPPSVLKYVDAPVPEPKPGEVLVRAHSIGVGIPDISIRKGTYSWMPPLPCTPGTEMSGTVEKLGAGVTDRRVGQRVIVTARERPQRGGCYAEYIATPADGTFVMPDGADMEAGATLANYQVAYHLLKDGARARKGDTVLVYGAAGGMGNALIDICKAWGMQVIGVASGDGRCDIRARDGRRPRDRPEKGQGPRPRDGDHGRTRRRRRSSIRSRATPSATTSRCSPSWACC